jgi:crotonobetainyl-CoA:carnitine CoA-transferase CaiB-like acyl-CoA transferase
MVEAVLATMPGPLLEYQLTGSPAEPAGNDDHVFSPHGVYRAHGDDSWIAIAITDQAEWEALVEAIEVPAGAATWNLEKRRRRSEEIDGLIGAWVSEQDPAEAARMLQTAGVPASESRSSHELVNDAHLNERGFFTMLKDRKGVDRLMPALPWRWQGGLNPRYGQPPALGGDTKFVLKSILGYSDSEIKTMEEAGALD